MRKAFVKDSLREIKMSFGRFTSIFAIIFVGVAFFAGIKSTAPDMKYSVDKYYDEYNMMDIRVVSTLGLTEDDISALSQSYGVKQVQAGYFCDALATIGTTQFVYKVHSIPNDTAYNPDADYINQVKLLDGKYPNKSGECIIEDATLYELDLNIGDKIILNSGNEENITESTLLHDEFTIVGIAAAPYYMSYEKGASDIGSGKANFFMMILEDDFIIPCYTEALITVNNAIQLNSYSEEYKALIEKTACPLENLGTVQTQARIDAIREEANAQLQEAKDTYNEQKESYDTQISEAEELLDDSKLELVEGQATLDANKESFAVYYKQMSAQLNDVQDSLNDAESEYTTAKENYDAFIEEYSNDLESLDETTNTLNESRDDVQTNLDAVNEQLENENLSDEDRASLEMLAGYYNDFIEVIDEQLAMLNGVNTLSKEQQQNTKDQLDATRTELDTQSSELRTAKSELSSSKVTADEEFKAAQEEIDNGWIEYETGLTELNKQKEEGKAALDKGLQQISDAEKEIEKLKKPQWYVLTREHNRSFVDYRMTADRIDSIAKIFPVFFFVVASLVCLTTMTRMVDEQRGNIGIHKALGYKNPVIAQKYILYAAIASIAGGLCGIFVGTKIFPLVIYNAWSMMYTLPEFSQTPQIMLLISSVTIGVLATALTALISCNTSLKEPPARLMRPKTPKAGKKVFLEKIKFMWSRLSFSQKVSARNLFRYKKRFIMTIIGIIGCCALLLAGFGLSNSISQVVDKQYNEIFTYHINMRFSEFANEEEKQEIIDTINSKCYVTAYKEISNTNAIIKSDSKEASFSLIVPSDLDEFETFITMRNRTSKKPITLAHKGLVITEKLSKELKVSIGDFVSLTNQSGQTKKVIISAIAENYVFHYGYMNSDYYKEIFLDKPASNSVMIKLNNTDATAEEQLGTELIASDNVNSLEYYSKAIATFSDTVKILNSIVIVIIISAGLLAFVVVYNLTNINICERIRELATLKVLGFYGNEVGAYVYRENIILAALGAAIGLGFGTVLHRFIMVSLEQDGIMFGYHIEPISFLYAFAITIGFVILVNLVMYRKIKNIPMVESLKSVE